MLEGLSKLLWLYLSINKKKIILSSIKMSLYWVLLSLPAVSGGGPSSISVTEEGAVSMVVSWVPPNTHVLQYRVTYTALTAPESQDSTVSVLELLQSSWQSSGVTENSPNCKLTLSTFTLKAWLWKVCLFSTDVGLRWWETGGAQVVTAGHTLQHPDHRRVPQQRRRQRLNSGQNQWVDTLETELLEHLCDLIVTCGTLHVKW